MRVRANANVMLMLCWNDTRSKDFVMEITSQSEDLYLPDRSARVPSVARQFQLTKGMAAAQLRLLRIFAL